jgi:2-phosphosulfolactate phosphatase
LKGELDDIRSIRSDLRNLLKQCGSGRELIERGFDQDVDIASDLDVSQCAPTLVDGAYINGFGHVSQEANSR